MGTRFVSAASILALSLQATVALAAEPTVTVQPYGNRDEGAIDLRNAYEPEAVYVTRVAASVSEKKITGSFTVMNADASLVTGVQYRLELRGINDVEGLPFMIDVVSQSLALAPSESKTLLFTADLPNIPAGQYDFRVQMLTAKGRSLGWQDTPVIVTDAHASADFIRLVPGTITIASYGDELLPPLSGPNVQPSETVTLHATASNNGNKGVRVTPVIDVYDFNAARVGRAQFKLPTFTIDAGASAPLDFPLTAEATPGVYMAHVTLVNAATQETISSIAQYRFVVQGEDADIVSVRLDSMGTTKGDWAYGTVDLAGAADALTTTTAKLRVQLSDDNGVVGFIEVPSITLTDSILTAKIRIPLERDLVGAPYIDATLFSSNNATFDHVTYAGTLTPAQITSLTRTSSFEGWVAWHGISRITLFTFLMALIGYAIFSLAVRIRGGSIQYIRTATATFMLITLVTQVTVSFAAGSGGMEVLTPKNGSTVFTELGNRPIIALFINSPVHNQANNFCNRQITLSYRVEYGVCENEIAYARVLGRVAKNGGHLTTYDAAGTQWQTVHDKSYSSQTCSTYFCFKEETFNETIDLTNVVNPGVTETTLQLVAKYGKNIAMPDSSFDYNDQFIRMGWAHGLNVNLQCAPQVGCIDVLKEGFDTNNNVITPLPPFSFTLDNNQTIQSDAQGRARFSNLTPGNHTVTEASLAGWTQFLVTPSNGTVNVTAGNTCAAVVFKNRKNAEQADLQIQKTGPTTVVRGQNAVYSLVVKNNGPVAAQNVIVGDPLPAGTTFVASSSDSRCQQQGNNVFCTLGTMTSGQQSTVQLTLAVPNTNPQACVPGSILNRAAVQSDLLDPTLSNNESSFTTQVTCPAPQVGCIDVFKEGFDANDNVVSPLPAFSFTLDNNQTLQSDTQGRARFSNVTPGNHTVTEASLAGWTQFLVTPSNGTVNVAAGNTCAAVVFKNRKNVQQADLQIQKTGPATVVRGQNAVYTLTVKNNGPTSAQNVIVGDPLPVGTTFVASSSDSRCLQQGNNVFCTLGTMTLGQQIPVQLTLAVPNTNPQACAPGSIVNRAAVQSDLLDPTLSNNESSFTTQVTCPAPQVGCIDVFKEGFDANDNVVSPLPAFSFTLDNNQTLQSDTQGRARFSNVTPGNHTVTEASLAGWTQFLVTPSNGTVNVAAGNTCAAVVFKNRKNAQQADLQIQMTGPTTIVRGQNAAYSLVAKNNGPNASPNTIVGDPLPAGTTFVAAQSDSRCSLQNNAVFCALGTMALDQQLTLPITLNVTSQSQCQPGNIVNQASILGDLQDPNMQNNQTSFTTTVTCQTTTADISVVKTGPSTVVRGTNITYQLVVSNAGPATANGVVLSDAVPSGLTLVSADTACTTTNGVITCQVGTLTTSTPRTFTFVFSTGIVPTTCTNTSVTNTGIVTSTSTDSNALNNQSSVTTQLTCPAITDKDVQIVKTGPTAVTRGDNFNYTLSVTNNGPATATNVVVSDPLPSGLVFVSASADCVLANSTVTCQAGTLTQGQQKSFTLTVNTPVITSCGQTSITNTGTVTSTGADTNTANNTSSLTTQINCPNVLLGCIDILKETFDTNGNVLTPVTQFSFTLDGTRTAVNDSLGRARFENVTLGSHTVTEVIPTGWTQQSVTPSGGTVNVLAGSCVTVTFKNRQSTTQNGGWTITKTDGESSVEPGDSLTYTITVRNTSTVRRTNITVIDRLPDEVEFQDASPNESDENGRTIRWENQTFEAGETRTYEVDVDVDDDADGTLLNTAEVEGITATDRTDVDDDNDHDGDAEIDLVKTANTSEVFPGGIIDYTVRIRNTSNGTIKNITVTDQLPADVIIINDGDADSRSGRRLEWELSSLKEDDEETFRYRVSVPSYMVPGQIVRNEVCVEADDLSKECESVTVSILGIIPTTGAKAPSQPHAFLKPVEQKKSAPNDESLPFLAVLALAGLGMGAGAGIGKRFLLGI